MNDSFKNFAQETLNSFIPTFSMKMKLPARDPLWIQSS